MFMTYLWQFMLFW